MRYRLPLFVAILATSASALAIPIYGAAPGGGQLTVVGWDTPFGVFQTPAIPFDGPSFVADTSLGMSYDSAGDLLSQTANSQAGNVDGVGFSPSTGN